MYDYLLKAKFSGFRVRHCLDSASIDTISVSVSVKKLDYAYTSCRPIILDLCILAAIATAAITTKHLDVLEFV